MNKKVFIGATLVTATVVGGLVYYRHQIMERIDRWLDDGDEPKPADDVFHEAMSLLANMTDEEARQFEENLAKQHPVT